MENSPFQGNLGGEYPYIIRMTRKEYFQKWYQANKHRYHGYYLRRKAKDPEGLRKQKTDYMRRYRAAHPEYKYIPSEAGKAKRRESTAKWRSENAERVKQQRRDAMRRAYAANPEKYRTRAKTWRDTNPERAAEIQKKVRRKRLPLFRAYYQNRLDTDVNFRIAHRLRSYLRKALKRNQKSGSAIELLGCSIPEFRIYLESLWEEGMVWSNYGNKKGQWNTDHLIPCALFDLTKPEHQKRCFHFSNLRPMWAIPNMSKGKKLITNQYNLI